MYTPCQPAQHAPTCIIRRENRGQTKIHTDGEYKRVVGIGRRQEGGQRAETNGRNLLHPIQQRMEPNEECDDRNYFYGEGKLYLYYSRDSRVQNIFLKDCYYYYTSETKKSYHLLILLLGD